MAKQTAAVTLINRTFQVDGTVLSPQITVADQGIVSVTVDADPATWLDPAFRLTYFVDTKNADGSWARYATGEVQGDPRNGFDKFGNAITPVDQSFTIDTTALAGKTARAGVTTTHPVGLALG
jgi:hypothetical protein